MSVIENNSDLDKDSESEAKESIHGNEAESSEDFLSDDHFDDVNAEIKQENQQGHNIGNVGVFNHISMSADDRMQLENNFTLSPYQEFESKIHISSDLTLSICKELSEKRILFKSCVDTSFAQTIVNEIAKHSHFKNSNKHQLFLTEYKSKSPRAIAIEFINRTQDHQKKPSVLFVECLESSAQIFSDYFNELNDIIKRLEMANGYIYVNIISNKSEQLAGRISKHYQHFEFLNNYLANKKFESDKEEYLKNLIKSDSLKRLDEQSLFEELEKHSNSSIKELESSFSNSKIEKFNLNKLFNKHPLSRYICFVASFCPSLRPNDLESIILNLLSQELENTGANLIELWHKDKFKLLRKCKIRTYSINGHLQYDFKTKSLAYKCRKNLIEENGSFVDLTTRKIMHSELFFSSNYDENLNINLGKIYSNLSSVMHNVVCEELLIERFKNLIEQDRQFKLTNLAKSDCKHFKEELRKQIQRTKLAIKGYVKSDINLLAAAKEIPIIKDWMEQSTNNSDAVVYGIKEHVADLRQYLFLLEELYVLIRDHIISLNEIYLKIRRNYFNSCEQFALRIIQIQEVKNQDFLKDSIKIFNSFKNSASPISKILFYCHTTHGINSWPFFKSILSNKGQWAIEAISHAGVSMLLSEKESLLPNILSLNESLYPTENDKDQKAIVFRGILFWAFSHAILSLNGYNELIALGINLENQEDSDLRNVLELFFSDDLVEAIKHLDSAGLRDEQIRNEIDFQRATVLEKTHLILYEQEKNLSARLTTLIKEVLNKDILKNLRRQLNKKLNNLIIINQNKSFLLETEKNQRNSIKSFIASLNS